MLPRMSPIGACGRSYTARGTPAGSYSPDALEVGEIEAQVSVESSIDEQGRLLREYRFKLQATRRELVRDRMLTLVDEVDEVLRQLLPCAEGKESNEHVSALSESNWSRLELSIAEIDTLLGSSDRPLRWGDLRRHLHFGMVGDLSDIHKFDWPAVKAGLRSSLYGQNDAVPVAVTDLGEIVAARPQGRVPTKLNWSVLSDEDFERLIFLLITGVKGYENPEWLQHTHAPDKGRDLSVTKVESDQLAGVRRYRVIIQCKHWQSRSVGPSDVSDARSQMELWQPPRVDQLIIATSGRFTVDAISLVEQHNQADRALHISMWPDSHLELLLAARPHLIGQFKMRRTG
jgi:Restriction endonuclease